MQGGLPPLDATRLDLRTLAPMQMPKLWCAVHDALMYNDAKLAAGGKVRSMLHLACAMCQHAPDNRCAAVQTHTHATSGKPDARRPSKRWQI